MDNLKKIIDRKGEHFVIAGNTNVEMTGFNGFEDYRLIHDALPGINYEAIDTSVEFLGKKLNAPLIISSMTGGTEETQTVNQNLAKACQKLNIALAVGSQRIAIEKLKQSKEKENRQDLIEIKSFKVRDVAPDILLLANLGAVQLNFGFGKKEADEAVSLISADGLYLHLNPLQEVIQKEGNKNFSDLGDKIRRLISEIKYPLIIKEVGNGISAKTARKLFDIGIQIVDVAGSGGTSWGYIEAKRNGKNHLAELFRNWGIPTAESLLFCRKAGLEVIASGGIRNGVEIVKAIAMGATLCGIALPFFEASLKSSIAVENKINELILELKVSMFCCGIKNIKELKDNKDIIEKIE